MLCKVFFTHSFKRSIKRLKKRFRKVKNDIEVATEVLLVNPEIGVLIPKGFGIRKLRVRNSDLKKGKSGSYRLLYFYYKEPSEPALYLLLLYLKSDQSNIAHETLMELLDEIPFEDKEETKSDQPNDAPQIGDSIA